MRVGIPPIGTGTIILVSGIVFFLQGNSVLGPTSSFMYSNPKWVVYGEMMIVAGMVIIGIGVGIILRHPRS